MLKFLQLTSRQLLKSRIMYDLLGVIQLTFNHKKGTVLR